VSVRPLSALAAAAAIVAAAGADAAGPEIPAIGARGTVRTVLAGSLIEELPVRFVGTLDGALGPGIDLYLVELEGPVGESIGIAAGMSGSPVSFEGRLFGALSYRLGGLPRRAIGGVTRIDQMRAAVLAGPAAGMPEPIATPLSASRLHPDVRRWLAEELDGTGLHVVAAGGSGSTVPAAPLEPGSAVGVALVRGDVDLAATGTVTAIDGDVVLAFGHPFLGTGRSEAPMVRAEVVHTLADLGGSFKIANVGEEIGAVLDDRLTAIAGYVGRKAAMIPVDVRIGEADGTEQSVRFEFVRRTALAPLLAGVGLANAVLGRVPFEQVGTVIARGAIELAGPAADLPVEWAAAGAGDGASPAVQLAAGLQRTLDLLYRNPFEEPLIEGIRLEVGTSPSPVSYRVDAVLFDRRPLRAGRPLRVVCELTGWRGAAERREIDLDVPHGIAPGTPLVLAVGAAGEIERLSGDSLEARLRTAGDFEAFVGALSRAAGPQRLTAALLRADGGVVAEGAVWKELPPSARRLANSEVLSGPITRLRASVVSRAEVVLDGPVSGVRTAKVVVR